MNQFVHGDVLYLSIRRKIGPHGVIAVRDLLSAPFVLHQPCIVNLVDDRIMTACEGNQATVNPIYFEGNGFFYQWSDALIVPVDKAQRLAANKLPRSTANW